MEVASVDVAAGSPSDGLHDKAFDLPSLDQISADLNNKDASIVLKMSHLFALREWGSAESTQLLIQALKDRNIVDSVLFRHEAAYVLGQLGSPTAVSFLEDVLADNSEDEMVRHEAAEALAAIGSEQSLKTVRYPPETTQHHSLLSATSSRHLSAYLKDPSAPVKETCELAVHSLEQKCAQRDGDQQKDRKSCFNTVDPSKAFEGCTAADVPHLFNLLMDAKKPLWERYRALFTLRDLRVPAAAAAVARALHRDKSSALLRHEIAFVLGQIQFPSSGSSEAKSALQETAQQPETTSRDDYPPTETTADAAASEAAEALVDCLSDPKEHSMARHEAALALGSLGADARAATCDCGGQSVRDIAVTTLQSYRTCSDKVVAESCLVALSNMQDELNASFGV